MHWRLLTLWPSRSLCLLPSSPSPCVFFYFYYYYFFLTYFALSTGPVVVVFVYTAAADIVFFLSVCVCVKNLLLCVFIFRHCLYYCVCVLCKVKVIKLYAQFILHSPHQQQQKQQQLSRKNRHEIIV